MTHKKTHKESESMPSAAKKLSIVHNDAPPEAVNDVTEEGVQEIVQELEVVEVTVTDASQPSARPEELRLLEALLFAADGPLDEATLKRPLPDGVDLKAALAMLQAEYATRGVNLVRIGKKWTFRTAGDLSWLLTKQTVETRKLSRAAIETLAIVAYHQPVTRAEIEEIRGVQTATGTLDVLLKTGWIRPRGRRKAPGRPLTYGTTETFLSHFGLEEVGDLPGLDELKGAGLLEGNMPAGFGVPMPSDDSTLRDDEDPLEPGDLDFGLAPPETLPEK
jgi:segregation and condensation protein B